MSAPESFIAIVQARLVNPRRNIHRAFNRINDVKRPEVAPADYDNALTFLREAQDQIASLEAFVNDAAQKCVCSCPTCGHTHYRDGNPA